MADMKDEQQQRHHISVGFTEVESAYERIKKYIRKTPVIVNDDFNSKYGRNFYFKAENMQKTGAFKIRGATNAVLSIKERGEDLKGLVTMSSGNHGKAMACVAKTLNIPCVVVCPASVRPNKIKAIADLGAEIITYPGGLQEEKRLVDDIKHTRGYHFIPPADDHGVLAGQGTICFEFLQQVPELDAVLIPVSGGGMLAGNCLSCKAIKPQMKVFAVQPVGKQLEKSLASGKREWPNPPESLPTIIDGMRTQQLGHKTWPIVLEHADKHVFTVTDGEAVDAMKYTFDELKMVIELAAGTSVAAAMSRDLQSMDPSIKHVGVILCGGNADLDSLPWVQPQ